ncbi:MAG: acyltransferase [Pseudolysinimonas sp.]
MASRDEESGAGVISPAPETVLARSLALDVLRIFAAAWVVTFHWSYLTTTLPGWLYDFMRAGYFGVDIFFMLSGAVIIHTAVGRTWSTFAQSRFLRLFPVYVAATALVLVFRMLTDADYRPSPEQWVGLTGVQFWLNVDPIIGAAWTLRYEVGFYLLITVLIIASRNLVSERTVRVGVYGFLVVWMLASATQLSALQFITLDIYGPMFVFGVLLGISRDTTSLRRNAPAIFVAGALTFSSLLQRSGGNHWTEASRVALVFAIIIGVTAVILWASLRPAKPVSVPWVHRWVATVSLMTYPIYLLHNEFGFGLTGWIFGAGIPTVIAYVAGMVVVVLISFLSVRFFEPWARSGLRRLFGWGTGARLTSERK